MKFEYTKEGYQVSILAKEQILTSKCEYPAETDSLYLAEIAAKKDMEHTHFSIIL